MKPSKSEYSEEGMAMVIVMIVMSLLWAISPAHAGPGWANSTDITGTPILVPTYYANSLSGVRTDPMSGAPVDTGTPLRKFVDSRALAQQARTILDNTFLSLSRKNGSMAMAMAM